MFETSAYKEEDIACNR